MCVCACHHGLALRPQIPTRGTGSGSRLVSISVYVFIYQFIVKHVERECSSVVHFKTHTRALVLSQSTWDALIFFLLCELFQVFVVLFFLSSKTSSAAAGSHRVCQKHHKYPVVVIVVFFPLLLSVFPPQRVLRNRSIFFPAATCEIVISAQ